ncbi:F-box/LRR-repeat protein [Caenorhabditis elegans]|uniref:F-box/LRR-repeat protein n=1 Tax=Caenorhabditis elegans TaxID=6239 RepID=Q9XUU1_CAEEL|nr:F-box/LRR-repeat protein [Caenorhabditis elegans]CAB04577.3 F-box/LRR-repeat protein [Caenorhabditis elegans]
MISSLYNLAIDKVITSITKGHYQNRKESCSLDPKSSNQIFATLLNNRFLLSCELNDIKGLVFNLTDVDLKMNLIHHESMKMTKSHCLDSLALGSFAFVHRDYFCGIKRINIVGILNDILNKGSQTKLKHLEIRSAGLVSYGWSTKISDMLPSLKSLKVTYIVFLKGISKLKNLQQLSIRDLEFRDCENLMDLFKLFNLRTLEMSKSKPLETSKNIRRFVECGMALPALRVMDCSGTDIEEELFAKLSRSHPKLEKFALLNCHLQYSTLLTKITVLNSATLASSLETLNYYTDLKRSEPAKKCLSDMLFLLRQRNEYDWADCLKIIFRVIETFVTDTCSLGSATTPHTIGILCVAEIATNNAELLRPIDATKSLRILLNLTYTLNRTDTDITRGLKESIWLAIFIFVFWKKHIPIRYSLF